jgi:hypothetical protein
LNPACSLKHYLKDFQNTTAARKDELYAELSGRRKQNGEQRTTRQDAAKSASYILRKAPTPANLSASGGVAKGIRASALPPAGRLKISFQSTFDCIALPDSGADDNVMPRSVVTELKENGLFVPLRTLKTPLSVELAIQGLGLKAEFHQQAQLNVELRLAAGPLCLRNCKWLIAEHEMDEVLLGRPLLEALGLNAQEHLSSVRDDYQNMDCSSVPSFTAGGKLTRLLLQEPVAALYECPHIKSRVTEAPAPTRLLSDLPDSGVILPRGGATTPADLSESHRTGDSVTYGELDVDPIEVQQLLDIPDPADAEEVSILLEDMISQAVTNGMETSHVPVLSELVNEFSDIWSISITAGPPASLPPLVIALKPDAVPVRVRLRRYSPEQRLFLARFVAMLELASMVYRNPRAAWCSAPLLVPKPGPEKFRFTVDLRPVNKQTVPNSWPMPHVESDLSRLHGSNYFATFALSHGYRQLPLAVESQECQSFITPDGVYSPTRELHVTTNAMTHLQ